MSTFAETRSIICPSCGAVVPPIGEAHARCAFCLGLVPIPPELRVPVTQQTALHRHFAAALEAEEVARRGSASQKGVALATGAALLAIGATNVIGMLVSTANNPQVSVLGLFAVTMGMPGAIVVAVAIAWLRHRGREARSLASLPLVWLVSDTLKPCCSRCGAEVAGTSEDVIATCRHCGTRGLLPCSMIGSRLRAKHARVVAARQRGDVLKAETVSLTRSINEAVGYAFIVAALAALVGMPTYYAVYPPHAYTGGPEMDVFPEIVVAAVFMSGILGVFGVLSIRSARKQK